jgi:phosphate-selective porin
MPRRRALLAFLMLVSVRGSAAAQTQADTAPIRLGPIAIAGYGQFDYRSGPTEPPDEDRTFYVRRARLQLTGPVMKGISWTVSGDASSMPALRDAYMAIRLVPGATVRFGQLPMPYGLERVTSSNIMPFTERVLTELAPGRDLGVVVSNERPFFGWLSYGAAVMNGTGQNTRDANGAKDASLRVTVLPFRRRRLQLGVNGARGKQPDGARERIGGDVRFESRIFQVAAEYLHQKSQDGLVSEEGFYASGGWRIYPATPRPVFDHIELAARFGRLTGGLAPSSQWDFAVNYYVQRRLRLMFDLIVPSGPDAGRQRTVFHARTNVVF